MIKQCEESITEEECDVLIFGEKLSFIRPRCIIQSADLSEETQGHLDPLRNALGETREVLEDAHRSLADDEYIQQLVTRVYVDTGTGMGDFWISF